MDPITAIYLGYGLFRDAVKAADTTLKTFETATGLPSRVKQLYSHVSATSFGEAAEHRISQSRANDLIRVGPDAFVNNEVLEVRNLNQHYVLRDRGQLTRLFSPLTQRAPERMFSSQVTSLPSASVTENPWTVLLDPRPLGMVSGPPSADHVPVIFEHEGLPFVGWQMRGTLPQLFGIDVRGGSAMKLASTSSPPGSAIAKRLRQRVLDARIRGVMFADQEQLTKGCWLGFHLAGHPIYNRGGYRFDFSDDTVRAYIPTGFTDLTFALNDFRGFVIKPRWGGLLLAFRNKQSVRLRNLSEVKDAVRFLVMVREELG